MNNNSISDRKVRLIYFRTYGDFSYGIGGDFSVNVTENERQETEFYVIYRGIGKRVLTICQPSLSVFRYLSPDDFMDKTAEYLKNLYNKSICKMFTNIDTLLSNIVHFSEE